MIVVTSTEHESRAKTDPHGCHIAKYVQRTKPTKITTLNYIHRFVVWRRACINTENTDANKRGGEGAAD